MWHLFLAPLSVSSIKGSEYWQLFRPFGKRVSR